MAFTNPGKIVRLRSRPNGRGSVHEANMWAQQHSDGLFSGRGVIRNTVADMNVLVGGTTDNPDVVLGKLPSGFLIALDIVGQQVIRITTPSSNKRIASVVAYSDNIALNSTDTNTTGSPSSCGLIVVYGPTSATPVAPTEYQIRQAVTQDGATGSQAVIAVIANITTESSTTTITDEMIAINYGKLMPHNIDLASLFAGRSYGDIVTVGRLMIQFGWTQFLGNNKNRMEVPIAFPKQFKKVHSITASFNGFRGSAASDIAEFTNPVGSGNVVEPGNITTTGCKLIASSRGAFGSAWHGVSWIAIGEA
nr:MAG TPA: putative tail fiber protein fold, Tail fiber, receptor [Caudoviricetes sp.]